MRQFAVAMSLLAGLVSPLLAQAGNDAVEVPLRMKAGRLLVPVVAGDGTHLEFALTTGAGVTVVSESTAATLGDSPTLTLGGLSVPMGDHATIPDENLVIDGQAADGLISPNMLNSFNILIDVPNGRLLLKPFGPSVAWGMALSDPIPIRVLHGIVLSLDVVLDGISYPGTLDLGTTTVVVNENVKTELGLATEGTALLGLGKADARTLAVRHVELDVFDRWSPNGDGFVIVGASVAEDCAISISWIHKKIGTCVQ